MSYRKKGSNKKYMIAGGAIIALILILTLGTVLNWWSPLFAPAENEASTFIVRSQVDNEDVSAWTDLSVWTPDPDATFDDDEDWFTLSNFDEDVSSQDADSISIDLRDFSWVWVEVQTSSSVWSNSFYRIAGGINREITILALDQSSDVNFNIMDETTLAQISAGALNGNYTCVMDVPHYNTANSHSGTNWAIDASDVADMTTSELEDLYDEANYQLQAPIYNPADDLLKNYGGGLEDITDAFAIRITMNTTISVIDGQANQVNVSLTESNDGEIEVAISGEYIYFIFTETLLFDSGVQQFDFEMVTAVNITYSTAQSGRLLTPYDDDNLSTFTAYSSIGA